MRIGNDLGVWVRIARSWSPSGIIRADPAPAESPAASIARGMTTPRPRWGCPSPASRRGSVPPSMPHPGAIPGGSQHREARSDCRGQLPGGGCRGLGRPAPGRDHGDLTVSSGAWVVALRRGGVVPLRRRSSVRCCCSSPARSPWGRHHGRVSGCTRPPDRPGERVACGARRRGRDRRRVSDPGTAGPRTRTVLPPVRSVGTPFRSSSSWQVWYRCRTPFGQTRPSEVSHPSAASLGDNAGHFWMFTMILRRGATVDALPPPANGGTWHYSHYPEGFHATVASVAQLIWPHTTWGRDDSLAAYWPASALVVSAGVTVLTAGLTSLPTVRDRWDIAAPLVGLLAAAYLFGLGSVLVSWGFASFVFSCSLVGCAFFIAIQFTTVRETSASLALGGAAVGVAHAWILLLTMMVPVALALVLPLSSTRLRGSFMRWVAAVLVVGATALGVWRAVTHRRGESRSPLVVDARWHPDRFPRGGCWVCSWPCAWWPFLTRSQRATSETQQHAAPTDPGVDRWCCRPQCWWRRTLGVIQVRADGDVGYYFWKYVCGAELVLLVLLTALVAMHVDPPGRILRGRPSGHVSPLAAAALVIGTTLVRPLFMGTGSPGRRRGPARGPTANTLRSVAAQLEHASRQTRHDNTQEPSIFVVSPGPCDTMNGELCVPSRREPGIWSSSAEAQAEALQGHAQNRSRRFGRTRRLLGSWTKARDRCSVPPAVHRLPATRPAVTHDLDRLEPCPWSSGWLEPQAATLMSQAACSRGRERRLEVVLGVGAERDVGLGLHHARAPC